mgnify:CR=1 FL=1
MTKCYLVVYNGVVIGKRAVGDPQPPQVPASWQEVDESTYLATHLGAAPTRPTHRPVWRNSDTGLRSVEERLLRLEAHLGLL